MKKICHWIFTFLLFTFNTGLHSSDATAQCDRYQIMKSNDFDIEDYVYLLGNPKVFSFSEGSMQIQSFGIEKTDRSKAIIVFSDGDIEPSIEAWRVVSENRFDIGLTEIEKKGERVYSMRYMLDKNTNCYYELKLGSK